MSKLSYKTLLIIFFSLLIAIVALWKFVLPKQKVSAAWWNDGWNYRVSVNIGNTGSSLTNFQVPISIGTSALINSGKMQSDCDDVRVVDQNGNLLTYWISGCNTTSTQIWPKIPSIPNGGAMVYIYYGNPSATSVKSTVGTSDYPGLSCKSILDAGNSTGNNTYWIDPTNGDTSDKFQAYCDMTNDSGGWMLVTQSMINSEVGVSTTVTKTVGANNGLIYTTTINGSGCNSYYSKFYLTDIIPWTKIKADYQFLGGNSCWGIFGNTNYSGGGSNLITFSSGTDTIRNQVKMGGSNGDNFDGVTSRCDNETYNFWHSNQGVGTTRSAQVILRRNSMSSLAGLATGAACVTNGYPWKYQNIYIREDAMTFVTTATPSTEEAGGGPIAYWKFDEGIGTTAYDSSKSNNGIITGATWADESQCISGKCLLFNGVNKLSVDENNILDNTGPISISIWVKPTTTIGIISIINRSGFTGPDNGFSLEIQDGKPTVLINNGRTTGSIQKCNQTINTNTFTHLEWTRDDSNNNKIFINGKECTYSSTINTTQISVNTTLGIGSKLNKQNIAPYMNYSNRTYGSTYTASSWGGDAATITYYGSGGYNDLPYKVLDKGTSGSGGSYLDDNAYINIQDNQTYIVSAWMKANQNVSLNGYSLCINRTADNIYRTGSGVSLTTNWQKKFWVYNSGVGHSGSYSSRHIIYDDTGLPLDIYWSGFTVENVTGTGKTNPTLDFTGYIDDVKVYNYARTADQIKQDYNSRGSLNGSSVNLGVKSSTAPDLNSKLVAYYKFDEGSGTTVYDSTTNQNNGTFGTGTSAPTWTNNSKFNKALSFNGSSNYLSTPRIPNITSNQITISAWINPNSISGTQEISNQGQWDGGPWTGWRFQLNSGHISFKLGDGTSIPYTYSAGSISTNNWQQVVGVWNGNYIYIYINGKEVGKSAKSFTYSGNSSTHWIGKYPGTGYFFNGLIDEVKIYNTALTPDEIKQDYNAGAATQFGATNQTIGGTTTSLEYCIPGDTSYCAPPIGEWKMDEKTGTTTKDISGNNNNGTITGATWTSGKIGAGLRFDGVDDYVSSGKDLLTSSPTTICTWFKLNTTSQDSAIVGNFASSYWTSYGKGFKYTNGTLYLMCENNNDKETISTSLNDTNWHYACGIIQTSTGKLYLDGAQVASGDLNSDGYNYWTDIGAATWRNTENTKNFNGLIDHIKIYNYARTPAQIAYDYNKGAPVGWWKFDDCQGLTAFDSSGLGNNAAISIGPSGTQNSAGTCQVGTSAAWTNGAIGKYNSSLNFDGNDDYVSIPNNSIFNLANTNHSFSLWFKAPSTMTDNPGMIFQRYTGGAPGAGYWIAISSNKVYYENRADGGDHLSITSNASYNDSIWHQVIITVDISSKIAKMYIDGKYIKSDNYAGNLLDNNANITFGGQGTSYSFQGQADDVRIYNYALTPEQVKTVYNNGAVNFN